MMKTYNAYVKIPVHPVVKFVSYLSGCKECLRFTPNDSIINVIIYLYTLNDYIIILFQGEEGVCKVLQILKEEFKLAMGLMGKIILAKLLINTYLVHSLTGFIFWFFFTCLGCTNLSEISRKMVVHQSHYSRL